MHSPHAEFSAPLIVTPMPKKTNRRRKEFIGNSAAFRHFQQHTWRTEILLKTGISGIGQATTEQKELLEKYSGIKLPPGPRPKNFKPSIDFGEKVGDAILVRMDAHTAKILRDAVSHSLQVHDQVRFHLYGILVVSTWGTFETYIYQLFQELFRKRPQMLISNEQCSYEEIVKNAADPVELLSQKQLIKIGRFSVDEYLDYMKRRIKFQPSKAQKERLRELYLVRNILTHNTGLVPVTLVDRMPRSLKIVSGELRITKDYLQKSRSTIATTVRSIERLVSTKFYNNTGYVDGRLDAEAGK